MGHPPPTPLFDPIIPLFPGPYPLRGRPLATVAVPAAARGPDGDGAVTVAFRAGPSEGSGFALAYAPLGATSALSGEAWAGTAGGPAPALAADRAAVALAALGAGLLAGAAAAVGVAWGHALIVYRRYGGRLANHASLAWLGVAQRPGRRGGGAESAVGGDGGGGGEGGGGVVLGVELTARARRGRSLSVA